MAESFGAGEAAVAGAHHDVEQAVSGFVEGHLAFENSGDVEVDVFGHSARGSGIGGELDHGLDWIADDIALPGGEEMNYESRGSLQGDAFGGGGKTLTLANARVFAIVVPDGGGRLVVFARRNASAHNAVNATGALRDDVLDEPPPSTTDRIAKYNQLLRIEEDLGPSAIYPGRSRLSGGGRGATH